MFLQLCSFISAACCGSQADVNMKELEVLLKKAFAVKEFVAPGAKPAKASPKSPKEGKGAMKVMKRPGKKAWAQPWGMVSLRKNKIEGCLTYDAIMNFDWLQFCTHWNYITLILAGSRHDGFLRVSAQKNWCFIDLGSGLLMLFSARQGVEHLPETALLRYVVPNQGAQKWGFPEIGVPQNGWFIRFYKGKSHLEMDEN